MCGTETEQLWKVYIVGYKSGKDKYVGDTEKGIRTEERW